MLRSHVLFTSSTYSRLKVEDSGGGSDTQWQKTQNQSHRTE